MSTNIFPTLPLLDARVDKEPFFASTDFLAPSLRRQTYLWSDRPQWRFKLRAHARQVVAGNAAATAAELEALWRFYCAHGGNWDSFLVRDQDDYQVSDHGFGVGDGSTTVFQLQRAMAGSVSDVLGTWPLYHKRRTNRIPWSDRPDNAAWGKASGSFTLTPNASVDPSGGSTACVVGVAAGQSNYILDAGSYTSGEQVTCSISAADGSVHDLYFESGQHFDLSTGTCTGAGASIVAEALGFYRCSVTVVVPGGVFPHAWYFGAIGNAPASGSLAIWRAQGESGAVATRPILTGASAAHSDPAYWPALGDGFEPITEIAPGLVVYVGDAPVWSGPTVPGGLFTFGSPPASGAQLAWSGSFYRRVRFAQRGLSMQRLMAGLWSAEGIELEQVIA